MKKIVILLVVLALFMPSMSFASSRGFHHGFHQGLGMIAAAAVVGIGANLIHSAVTPTSAYAGPPQQPCYPSPQYSARPTSDYEYYYAKETMRLQREAEMRARQFEREQAIRNARRDYGYR